MDENWDDDASPVQWVPQPPQQTYQTQVFTNSRDRNSSWNTGPNWRDDNRNNRGPRPNFRDGQRDDRNGFKGNRRPNNGRQNNEDAIFIKVPSKFVGRIIGRGGSKISDLQLESGARINVTRDTEGDDTMIKLIGDQDAVAKAQELIGDLIVERDGPYSANNSTPYSAATTNTPYSSATNAPYSAATNAPYSGATNAPYSGATNAPYSAATNAPYSAATNTHYSATTTANNHHQEPQATETKPQQIVDWKLFIAECEASEKAEWDKLPPIKKDFYVEHPDIAAMTDEEVAQFRSDNNNVVVERTFKTDHSKPIPKPVITFEHAFHNYPEVLEEIAKAGFETPSPIQSQAWPVLLSGEDLIGIAQTGTGKTLAFLLPAMIHIDGQLSSRQERGGPAVLVMAPTRELALQIDKEVKKYEYRGITAVCIYGGGNRREQIKVVTEGVDIVIATPGRLNDLIEAGHLKVRYVTYVVLDEADRMLDMGFEPQIRKVMYSIRPTRQTVMTSATWPVGVRRLAQSYMVDPIQVYVGTLDLAATHTVTQVVELMPDNDEEKLKFFMDFARNLTSEEKAIVFCGKKARADDLASELTLAGLACQTIHGDREQSDREQALKDITNGTVQILIATDVASRGLDIDDITHVVNYDFPRNIEEYVHRVGRTGRAGKSGKSISYFTRGDWSQAKELIAILEEADQFVPEEIYQMAERHTAWKEKKDADRPQGGRPRFGNRGGGRRW